VPIGMVSEGDLIGRDETERLARRDWWLELMSGARRFDDEFRANLQVAGPTARDVMAAPLVTVTEDAELDKIAGLMAVHRVKRLPVLHDGRVTGIVSRADLLRVLASATPPAAVDKEKPGGFLVDLFGAYHRPAWQVIPPRDRTDPAHEQDKDRIDADTFTHLVADFHNGETRHRDDTRREAASRRQKLAETLIDVHVSDEDWRQTLHHARIAAENGQIEYQLLRFPSEVCIDGGRAINVTEVGWPGTLRGEPAELYLRWERELKPLGFRLSARVLEFPGGKPGDIGLFLAWPA
jgi:hypothetical protein